VSRYRFELAAAADDADLREILARTPMDGTIALSFCREPSFFAAPGVDGFQSQVVACRDTTTGRLVGFGCRSLRRQYVNGQPAVVGYLSSLRLLAEHRNQGLIARGYRYFRELHGDGRTPLYLTTIAEGNDVALRLLTSGRAGLPAYHEAGRYHTVALPLRPGRAQEPPAGLDVQPASESDWPAIFAFLQEWGPRRQFFPCYDLADVQSPRGALFGLRAQDVLLARRNGSFAGVLAGWDQQGFRQTVVHGYRGLLSGLRPLYNGWASLRRRPTLPAPGQRLRYLTAALPVVAGDDAAVFDALVGALLHREGRYYLVVALAEGDPLLSALRRWRGTWYTTRIFHVCSADGEAWRQGLDGRPPYLELGSL
jgi:hypothetical protein